jgi:hypothetical protein
MVERDRELRRRRHRRKQRLKERRRELAAAKATVVEVKPKATKRTKSS